MDGHYVHHGAVGALQAVNHHSAADQPHRKVQPAPIELATHDGVVASDPSSWQVVPRQWELADFKPLKKLYRGYASKVYLAEDCGKERRRRPDGEIVSMPVQVQKIVLKVYDLLRLSPLTKYQLQRETDFCILVQDYAVNGDLYSYLHKNRIRLSEERLVRLVLQPCLSALAYLHAHNIIHRDIKPENLLLAEGDVIKLADFGLSVSTDDENPVTRAGTLDYMAPEVLVCPLKRLPTDHKDKAELAYTDKVDSWSMGVLAYELLTGKPPFSHRDETVLLQAIKSNEVRFPSTTSSAAKEWVRSALVVDAHARTSVTDLLKHPWIQQHKAPESTDEDMYEAGASAAASAPGSPVRGQPVTPESVHRALLQRRHMPGADGADGTRSNSISPAMTAIRLNDDSNMPSGCRSPAALHLEASGDTPNPFGSPATSTDGPPRSPTSAAQAGTSRSRGRQGGNLATRALSSLNPARASGVIGNIFGNRSGRESEDDGSRKQPDAPR